MKTNVETLEPTKVKLSVQVSYEELEPALKDAYKEIGKQVTVPGFRRGHVPARIIDQNVGRGYVIQEAVNQKLGDYYSQAVTEAEIIPLNQPQVDVTDLPAVTGKPGGDLAFTAEVEVLPELDIPSVKDLTIEVDPVEITDDDINEELSTLQARFGSLKTVEREAKEGDFTSIDMTARIGEEEIDSVSGVSYEVGSGTMLEGMDEALKGMKAGENTTFTSRLRGGDHEGEEGTVDLTLRSVKERELPELDDDFAQMASEFDTIDELREDLKNTVSKRKSSQQALQARDKLMDHLRENVEVPLPSGILEEQQKQAVNDEMSEEDQENTRQQIHDALRDQLLQDRIAEEQETEVSQNELFDMVMQMSQAYGIDASQLLTDQQQVTALYQDLRRNKGLALLLADVTVKDTNGNDVDLTQFLGLNDEDADGEADQSEENAQAAAQEAEDAKDSE